MMQSPKIGLTMRLELETDRFYLGRDYCEALEHFGAIPFHIPLIPKRDYLRKVLSHLDGILLPGSDTDVDPLRFDEEPHPKLKKVVYVKEETDLIILDEAERLGMPVLGICFGMQILNVYRGGTLVQDIESMIPNFIKHEQGIPLGRNSHRIEIKKGSLPDGFAGKEEVKVNSHHHQSIKSIGRHLKVSAVAKDGVIECIEDERDDRFILGVQWHPELSWKEDNFSKNIFQYFVNEAAKYALKENNTL